MVKPQLFIHRQKDEKQNPVSETKMLVYQCFSKVLLRWDSPEEKPTV